VIEVEFRGAFCRQKTRFPGLSCGVLCVILHLELLYIVARVQVVAEVVKVNAGTIQ